MSDLKKNKQGSGGENPEPSVRSELSPVWVFVVLGVILFLGMGFLAERAGGFRKEVYEPYYSYDVVKRSQGVLGGEGPIERGEKVYKGKGCVACHQASGSGTPGQFPPLAGSDWVKAEGPERVIRIVLHGVAGPITVNGQAYNGAMPLWKGVLTDKEIADVLSYVRNSWGNKGSIVTEAQVKAISDKEGSHNPWLPADLLALPDKK